MMNWMREWGSVTRKSKSSSSNYSIIQNDHNRMLYAEMMFSTLERPWGYPLGRNTSYLAKFPCSPMENFLGCKRYAIWTYRQYTHSVQNDVDLSRDFFVGLWVADRKKLKSAAKRNHKVLKFGSETFLGGQKLFGVPVERLCSGTSVVDEESYGKIKSHLEQPPTSQSVLGRAKSVCSGRRLLSRISFIREQSNLIARQLLHLRHPFVASITDDLGNELFRVRRPFWLITSSIYAKINGKEIVVHRRWHLWRRIYDLYLGNKQFAAVENLGFWNWTFTLKDIDGNVLAEVDRDWRGFGFEIFTDAGQYVIRFRSSN